mmetsp:Transcript_16197/g.28786  ORF Transcript_16197/g.28786 Transcript_16197/m.28786 type:complete len:205 (+) Transcript_16197:1607-2221(+)
MCSSMYRRPMVTARPAASRLYWASASSSKLSPDSKRDLHDGSLSSASPVTFFVGGLGRAKYLRSQLAFPGKGELASRLTHCCTANPRRICVATPFSLFSASSFLTLMPFAFRSTSVESKRCAGSESERSRLSSRSSSQRPSESTELKESDSEKCSHWRCKNFSRPAMHEAGEYLVKRAAFADAWWMCSPCCASTACRNCFRTSA